MAAKPKRVPTVTPFLWFDKDLEEAARYYAKVFPGGKVLGVQKGPDGKAFSAQFEVGGQRFMGLNAGPTFRFTEAVSFFVECKDQAEVDYYWDTLVGDGGQESQCGWLKDRFGLSWQIIPEALTRLLSDPDPQRAGRAMQAMLGMRRLDVQALEDAAAGKATPKARAAAAKGQRTAKDIVKDYSPARAATKATVLTRKKR